MPSFHRETLVDAPLDEVWAFHASIDGLQVLTPNWMGLRIESIDQPQHAPHDSRELVAGTELHLSVSPFWMLPRQSWVSIIESRTEHDDVCSFLDSMHDGPFETWKHRHRFVAAGEQTRVIDTVDYRAPCGTLGQFLASGGLSTMFAYRHWKTREMLGEP